MLHWHDKPQRTKTLSLCCPRCGNDAAIEIADMPNARVIAAIGLGLIFDPPGYQPAHNFMPDEVKCRNCRTIFSSIEGTRDVR